MTFNIQARVEELTSALMDALTHISGRIRHAGDRAEIDSRIGRLLTLAA